MDGGAWWAAVHGVAKSRTGLSDFTFTFHFHALEKEMATHSSVLAWRIPGTGEPGRLPSMGSHRVGHDWSDLAAAAAAGSISFLPGEIVLNYVLLFRISFLPLAQGLDLRSIFKKPVFFFFLTCSLELLFPTVFKGKGSIGVSLPISYSKNHNL